MEQSPVTTENALASEDAKTETGETPETAVEKDETTNLQVEKEQETDASADKPEKAEKEDPADKGDEPEKPKKKGNSAQERIKQLTDQRNERDRKIADLEKRLARFETKTPDPDKFDSDADYQRALAEHTAKSMRRADIEEDIKEARGEVDEARRATWNERASEFSATVEDFEKIAYTAPISDAVAELLMESEYGPQIAYALGKDPAKAREISAMPPSKAALTIGRMEADMAPKPKKISNAPPPVETVGSSSRSSEPDPAKMSMSEYVKWREKGGG